MCSKKLEKFFSSLDNFIWIGCVKLSLFTEKEHLHLRVNMLTDSLEILDTTKSSNINEVIRAVLKFLFFSW